jgi:hypothetical protein
MRIRVLLAAVIVSLAVLPSLAAEKRIEVDVADRPFLGAGDAPVTVVEFLDFQ